MQVTSGECCCARVTPAAAIARTAHAAEGSDPARVLERRTVRERELRETVWVGDGATDTERERVERDGVGGGWSDGQ